MISRALPALRLIALEPISAADYLLAMGGDLETARAALADLIARGLATRKFRDMVGYDLITITAAGRKTLGLAAEKTSTRKRP